jgi:hypothetical protein
VIDPIEDDNPDDADDFDAPEPNWWGCPTLLPADMLAMIQRNKGLDGRAVNLFRNALKGQPRSGLLEHYIGPNLYHPGSHYMYTTPDPRRSWSKNWRSAVQISYSDYLT